MSRLFDETVEIVGGGISTSVSVCRMDGSFDSPMGESTTASNRVRATFSFRLRDWCRESLPKIGWTVRTVDGTRFEVRFVQRLADIVTMDAREAK